MAPTRKYLEAPDPKTNPISVVLVLLILAALFGLLIWANIEIWTTIF